jgi:ABC-type transport system substrate-binding protein
MRRKHVLSLLMLSIGVALLAATAVEPAASATRKTALRGGTLRIDQVGAFDTLDPQLAYVSNDWWVLYSTQLLLLNYPNAAGQAGAQLFPEAAKAFPSVSRGGKVYTFHLRSGLRFSDGSKVSAVAFQRAFERTLSPRMFAPYGIYEGLNTLVVGARAFAAGKAAHISGVKARGLTLTIRLTKPHPAFIKILGMQWFGAVKPNMPYTNKSAGILKYPSAGPYYIAANHPRRLVVLKRNPYYHGSRPANPDEIVIHSYPSSNGEASLRRVEKNQIDYASVPSAEVQAVAQKYGYPSNKHSRFHVATTDCEFWDAFNNTRPPTNDARVRKALNYAIGRVPIIDLSGPYSGTATDQVLVPGLPGYKKLDLYGNQPNVAKAEAVGGSALKNAAPLNIYYNPGSQIATSEAQLEQSEIEQIGLTVTLITSDPSNYYGALETKGSPTPWNIAAVGSCPNPFDPSGFFSDFFRSPNIPRFNDPSVAEKLDHAASLSGPARARAYAELDKLVMTKYAPVAPISISNLRYLVSKRVRNIIFSHYLGGPILNAMSVR